MKLNIYNSSFRRNPYSFYDKLRQEAPICQADLGDGEKSRYWIISRYQDIVKVLKNPKIFSSSGISEPTSDKKGIEILLNSRGMVDADPPDHSRLRSLISKAFIPIKIAELEPRIRFIVQELLCRADSKGALAGEFDLIQDFAMPLPVVIIAELLGIDSRKQDEFQNWAKTLITWRNAKFIQNTEERRKREQQVESDIGAMASYFLGIIEEKRCKPSSDLISALLQASEMDQKLTLDEVLSFIRLLLVAGTETVTNFFGNTVLALIRHPNQWMLVKKDPTLIPKLIEEGLRYDGPVLGLIRRVNADSEVAGIKMVAGDFVFPLLASGNHDPSQFVNAEVFDIQRSGPGHLSFGNGIHFCLGAYLLRLQAQIAFEEIFRKFDKLELNHNSLEYIDSFFFRGLKSLKIRKS